MGRSIALGEVLDKHQIRCPRCECREAIVLLDAHFNVHWQCVECEWRWAASEEEAVLLLNSTSKTVH
jgi:hypothetical protein